MPDACGAADAHAGVSSPGSGSGCQFCNEGIGGSVGMVKPPDERELMIVWLVCEFVSVEVCVLVTSTDDCDVVSLSCGGVVSCATVGNADCNTNTTISTHTAHGLYVLLIV